MGKLDYEVLASEILSKTIQKRVFSTEHSLGKLCESFSSYTRKLSRLQNEGDELCHVLKQHAQKECLSQSSKNGIQKCTEYLSLIQDYQSAQIKRLQRKVVQPLCQHGVVINDLKSHAKRALSEINQELNNNSSLKEISHKKIFPITTYLTRRSRVGKSLSGQSLATNRELYKKAEDFEKTKLLSIKNVLLEFVKIEMSHHAKSLELLTGCFEAIKSIDPESDFMNFTHYFNSIRPNVWSMQPLYILPPSHCELDISRSIPSPRPVDDSLPYTLVNTGGVLHYKMKDSFLEDTIQIYRDKYDTCGTPIDILDTPIDTWHESTENVDIRNDDAGESYKEVDQTFKRDNVKSQVYFSDECDNE